METSALSKPVTLIQQTNIYPHRGLVTREARNRRAGHQSGVVWLTGLSGAGKSTVAVGVEEMLFRQGYLVTVLDGDTIRAGLNSDLDFTTKSREENLRRAGEVTSLFASAGHIVIATFVSPHHNGRELVRGIVRDNFYLVHVCATLDDCAQRDPKGLYKKAMAGRIENFTGIGQSYEDPEHSDLVIDTSEHDVESCRQRLASFIMTRFALETETAV